MAFELVDKRVVYDGKKVRLELHRLRNDANDNIHSREIVVHPGAVVILPVLDDETILLIRSHRYAVRETMLELPAGTLEKDEVPMNCAGRELLEETGYLAGTIIRLGAFYSSPGIMTEKMYAYAATDLEQSTQALEEGEEIEVVPTRFDEAIEMIGDGRIIDGKSIATLLMYDRFHRSNSGSNRH